MGIIKTQRIQANYRPEMQIMKEIVTPEVLHAHVPRLASVAEARTEKQNAMQTMMTLGKYARTGNFDPTRQFQYVANIDQSVWRLILNLFAKHDPETGELMDDGMLYVKDEQQNIKLNRSFFYAILDMLEQAGYNADMRGKVKLN